MCENVFWNLAKCLLPCFLRFNLLIPFLHTPHPKAAHTWAVWRLLYYPGTCRALSKVFAVKYKAHWNVCGVTGLLGWDWTSWTLKLWPWSPQKGYCLPVAVLPPSPGGPHNGFLAKEKCSWLAHFHSFTKYHRRSCVTVLTKENALVLFLELAKCLLQSIIVLWDLKVRFLCTLPLCYVWSCVPQLWANSALKEQEGWWVSPWVKAPWALAKIRHTCIFMSLKNFPMELNTLCIASPP